MAALTAARTKTDKLLASAVQHSPQKGATTIYQGGIVMLDSSGYARPGATATDMIAVGRALDNIGLSTWDNSAGSDGDLQVKYEEGIFLWDNSGGGDALAAGDEGKVCFIVDDQTVAKTSNGGTRSPAGRVHSVVSAGVFVIMSRKIARAIASGVYTQTYSTADRTVANPTSAALTENAGAIGGTNDGDMPNLTAAAAAPNALTATAIAAPDAVSPGAGADVTTPSGAQWTAGVTLMNELKTDYTALLADVTALRTVVANLVADNVALRAAIREVAVGHNEIVADDLDNRRSITALIDDLQSAGIVG